MGNELSEEVSTLLKRGKDAVSKNDFNTAKPLFKKVLKIDAECSYAYFGLGMIEKKKKNYSRAIKYFTKANEKKENFSAVLFNRGATYIIIQKYKSALKDLTKVLKIKPDHLLARNNRGLVYLFTKEYEKAERDFSQVLKTNPKDQTALNNRGKASLNLKNFHNAIKDSTRAIHLNSRDFRARYNRAMAYKMIENFDKCLADLDTILKMKISDGVKGQIGEDINDVKELISLTNSKERKHQREASLGANDVNLSLANDSEFLQDVECKICFERKSSITFLCGHLVCPDCAEQITEYCPFCQTDIKMKIKLFF